MAFADWKKNSEFGETHSIGRFQEQMIKKCFAGPPVLPLEAKLRFVALRKQEHTPAEQVQILAVIAGSLRMVRGKYILPTEGPPHLLVLWLRDDAFRDTPLARLADLISWFRLKFSTSEPPSLPHFLVLGPDNSGTLRAMVREARSAPWHHKTRECLATTRIYSSQAEAAETRLLYDISELGIPRTCKHLIEENVKGLTMDSGFCFERTIPLDNQIVKLCDRS